MSGRRDFPGKAHIVDEPSFPPPPPTPMPPVTVGMVYSRDPSVNIETSSDPLR